MKVGEILFKQGFVEQDSIQNALEIQTTTNKNIGEILVGMGVIQKDSLDDALVFQKSLEMDRYVRKAEFLGNNIPFSLLSRDDLDIIADTMEWDTFAPAAVMMSRHTRPSRFFVIRTGLVKVYLEKAGGESVVGYLGEGEYLGETPILREGANAARAETLEPTLCLAQGREAFLQMLERFAVLHDHFQQLLKQRMRPLPIVAHVEPTLYKKQVKDLLIPNQALCHGHITIKEAARELTDRKVDTIIVTDGEKTRGTVGHKDLSKAILLDGKDPEEQISVIIETNYSEIDSESFLFDAIHEMVNQGTDKLVVLDKGKPIGLLTTFDILRLRGIEVLSLLRNIEEARSFSELNRLRREVEKVLMTLVSDGARSSRICKIISELNDKIVKRAIRLVEQELGRPPSSYAWLGLGSEGRREQTLITDQDNALIFLDSVSGNTEYYFRTFAERVVQGLNKCGFPFCKGNIMATNPKFFGDLAQWKKRTAQWADPMGLKEEEMLDILTFLDFRTVHGNHTLENKLKQHIINLAAKNPSFVKSLAELIVLVPIPLGFFKNFIVEKDGKYKHTLNLKTSGLLPLTTCLKLLTLQKGLFATNSLERVRELNKKSAIEIDQLEFLEQAFETFLSLRIKNDLNCREQNKDFHNRLDPATLTTRQKQLLKEAFLTVSRLQKTTQELLKIEGESRNLYS